MPKEKHTTKQPQRKVQLCQNCGGYTGDSKCCKNFRPQVPEETHAPKLLLGKVALCKNCESFSRDISRCTGCKTIFPDGTTYICNSCIDISYLHFLPVTSILP